MREEYIKRYHELLTEKDSMDRDYKRLRTHAEALAGALPDAGRLDLLADWIDKLDKDIGLDNFSDDTVQRDLRNYAKGIRTALTAYRDTTPEEADNE